MQQFHVNTEKGTLTSCTHPNGHHNSKQSCPKTSRLNECMISVWYVLCILLQMHSIYHINIFHHHMKNGFIFNPCTGRQRISNSSQMKVTKMLLIVSSVFVLLNLPSYVLRVISFLWVNYSLWICCCYCRKKYYCIVYYISWTFCCCYAAGSSWYSHCVAIHRSTIFRYKFRYQFCSILYERTKFQVSNFDGSFVLDMLNLLHIDMFN